MCSIFPSCYGWNFLLLIKFTHRVTGLLRVWRRRWQVTQSLRTTLTQDYSNLPIQLFRTNFCLSWGFKKCGFHCRGGMFKKGGNKRTMFDFPLLKENVCFAAVYLSTFNIFLLTCIFIWQALCRSRSRHLELWCDSLCSFVWKCEYLL